MNAMAILPRGVGDALREAAHRALPVELRGNEKGGWASPHEVVGEFQGARVLYYAPAGAARSPPVVYVYSLINRSYIMDFQQGRSLVAHLAAQGHPGYLIDWGTPTAAHRHKTWADYLHGVIGRTISLAAEREGTDRATLYGYCMGGTLALAYAALRPERVRAFVAMATPVDFHDDGLLSTWTRPGLFNVDALVDGFGNVPTWLMESGFRMLQPLGNVTKWRDLWEGREKEGFVEMWRTLERWSADNVAFPGEVYRQYIRDCYQRNAFVTGEMVVGGERVDLGRIESPVLVLTANKDHIAPKKATHALLGRTGSKDVTHLEYATGHIGLSTSGKGPKEIWPAVDQWLRAHAG